MAGHFLLFFWRYCEITKTSKIQCSMYFLRTLERAFFEITWSHMNQKIFGLIFARGSPSYSVEMFHWILLHLLLFCSTFPTIFQSSHPWYIETTPPLSYVSMLFIEPSPRFWYYFSSVYSRTDFPCSYYYFSNFFFCILEPPRPYPLCIALHRVHARRLNIKLNLGSLELLVNSVFTSAKETLVSSIKEVMRKREAKLSMQ